MKKIVITVCIILLFCNTSNAWISQDPNVFDILYDTVWEFHYNNCIYHIGFYNEYITDSNGNIVLPALNLDIQEFGTVKYGTYPLPTSGIGFMCMILDAWFHFNTIDSRMSGQYFYYNSLNPNNIQSYPLMGYKIYDIQNDQNQPVYFDQNQPVYFDQNQPIQIDQNQIETDQNQIDDSGGCFLQSFILFFGIETTNSAH